MRALLRGLYGLGVMYGFIVALALSVWAADWTVTTIWRAMP